MLHILWYKSINMGMNKKNDHCSCVVEGGEACNGVNKFLGAAAVKRTLISTYHDEQ